MCPAHWDHNDHAWSTIYSGQTRGLRRGRAFPSFMQRQPATDCSFCEDDRAGKPCLRLCRPCSERVGQAVPFGGKLPF